MTSSHPLPARPGDSQSAPIVTTTVISTRVNRNERREHSFLPARAIEKHGSRYEGFLLSKSEIQERIQKEPPKAILSTAETAFLEEKMMIIVAAISP